MKKLLIYVFLLLAITGCSYRKQQHKHTYKIKDELYVEYYRAGIMGVVMSEYLTDSTNFRLYLGTFDDEHEKLWCDVKGDMIYTEIIEFNYSNIKKSKVLERKTYSLKQLKWKHDFE